MSAKQLLRKTFSLPSNAGIDRLIALRVLKNTLRLISVKNNEHINKKNQVAIYDQSHSSMALRKEYINYYAKQNNCFFISKQTVSNNQGFFDAVIKTGTLIFITILILPFTIFSNNRASISLIPKEIVETYGLLLILYKRGIKSLHYFSIFANDANVTSLVLQQFGVYVNKIPSEVPLYSMNKTIIADSLSLCFGYQKTEVNTFTDSIFVDKVNLWGPETALEIADLYPQKFHEIAPKDQNVIGYYSSADWLRKKEQNVDLGYNAVGLEKKILSYLKEFITLNPKFQLKLYLHPREKKSNQHIEESKRFYANELNDIQYTFSDFTKPSNFFFHQQSIVVSLYSTLIYERLFFGFKTLIMPFRFEDNFPLPESGLHRICSFTKEHLFEKLTEALPQSNEEFFIKNRIENYARFYQEDHITA